MNTLDAVKALTDFGFRVFPVVGNGKTPAIEDFPHVATRDFEKAKRWFYCDILDCEQPLNIGISTGRFGSKGYLLVVDIDNKEGKDGDGEIVRLELEGEVLPETFEQITPTGGRHLFFIAPSPSRNSTSRIAQHVDVRGLGGYVVGHGSTIDGKMYTANFEPIAPAPQWLIDACVPATKKKSQDQATPEGTFSEDYAVKRARRYLQHDSSAAVSGEGGNHRAYVVACSVKDLGVPEPMALDLMLEHWNDRCDPPWDPDELGKIVGNAYRYGTEKVGANAPETRFPVIASGEAIAPSNGPIADLNREYAFIIAGGSHHILHETRNAKGNSVVEHISELAFHRKLASRTISIGNGKTEAVSRVWMSSEIRRSYDGFCFAPAGCPPNFYNLWRGFSVTPVAKGQRVPARWKDSLKKFTDHALENVCGNDKELFNWLMGYFAHLVQRPEEKPLVALVFRGEKGVGKNALIDRVGHLVGSHYLVTSDRRYLSSNFNAHLENCLLFALDEAFWSGDKQIEGILKNLITGRSHVIEQKGKESYTVDNCTRVAILGNEEWLVPASQDERRYAVFDVGPGRKQDRAFFQSMREGMEQGGYRLLLRYLLDFDISTVDINQAPATRALLEQKLRTMEPLMQWWFECLQEEEIVGSQVAEWPTHMEKSDLLDAFHRYVKKRDFGFRVRSVEPRAFGRKIREIAPSLVQHRGKRPELKRSYEFSSLDEARNDFGKHLGHTLRWDL